MANNLSEVYPKQLFAAKYLAHLPTEEELRIELQKDRAQVQAQQQSGISKENDE